MHTCAAIAVQIGEILDAQVEGAVVEKGTRDGSGNPRNLGNTEFIVVDNLKR